MSTTPVEGSSTASPEAAVDEKSPIVAKGMVVLFLALLCCFTVWGIAADMTTPMVAGFKRIFDMSTFQSSLVQLAYYGAYFLLALPAAFINQRWGYKAGVLIGLALAAIGAFAFYPASKIMTYEAFLVALFAMAAGCSILETSANPYVISLGDARSATRRLNFAQAFNPIGTNIGVLVASTLILPKLVDPVDTSGLSPAQLQTIRSGELGAVMGPYLGLAMVLILIFVAIAVLRSPDQSTAVSEEDLIAGAEVTGDGPKPGVGEMFGTLWRTKRYRFGVVAQFCNIGAQVCTWTYIIQYVGQALHGSLEKGGNYLQVSLIAFLVSRFVMTWLIGRIRPTKVMGVLSAVAVALCVFAMVSPNLAGVLAVASLSICLSLMFPTIYGVALNGLGPAMKFGAAGLVMAIVGGAIMPLVQGKLVDAMSPALSFIVPAVLFAVVGLYSLYDLRAAPTSEASPPTAPEPSTAGAGQ